MNHPAYTSESAPPARRRAAGIRAAAANAPAQPSGDPNEVLAHPERPEITVTFEYVTPEVAKHYLTKSPDWQRNESDLTTDAYVEDMLDSDWWFTGDPMRFTAEGEFFDGQHRANAIVTSGKAQWVLVVRGLPQETMRVLDTGYQRKFTNYLSTQKIANIQHVAGVTGKILDWRRGNYAHPDVARVPSARYLRAKKAPQKLINTFEELRGEIISAVSEGNYIRGRLPHTAPSTTFAFAHLYLKRLDAFKCAQFFDELTGKVAQASADTTYPIRALEKALTSRAGEKGVASYHHLGWIFLAWNEWLDEQPLSRDRFRAVRKPQWRSLVIPTDPHADSRPEGWVVL